MPKPSSPIVYEQPLNERVRLLLRFEDLLDRYGQACAHPAPWGTHCALTTLAEFQSLVGRDIKRDLIKEVDRVLSLLTRLADEPRVDGRILERTIARLRHALNTLHETEGQLDQSLIDSDFFNSIRQRIGITGGTCGFDLPAYQYWLHQPHEVRMVLLDEWIAPFRRIGGAIDILLELIRGSTPSSSQRAEGGYFEKTLDASLSWQMIRVEMDPATRLLPEISAGKHRFTIRFLDPGDLSGRPRPCKQEVEFALACCAL